MLKHGGVDFYFVSARLSLLGSCIITFFPILPPYLFRSKRCIQKLWICAFSSREISFQPEVNPTTRLLCAVCIPRHNPTQRAGSRDKRVLRQILRLHMGTLKDHVLGQAQTLHEVM